jgi:formyl-CoA transferase
MMLAIDRVDLADDPELSGNDGRAVRSDELDTIIGDWCALHDLQYVLDVLEKAEVPSGKIYDVADIVSDVHYRARNMIEEFKLSKDESLLIPGIVPKLSDTPGKTQWLGPDLGEHTDTILSGAGYSMEQIQNFRDRNIV